MHQLPRLLLDCLEDVVVAVTESVDCQAADEVEIAIAVEVGDVDAVGGGHEEGSALFGEDGVIRHADMHVVEDGLS